MKTIIAVAGPPLAVKVARLPDVVGWLVKALLGPDQHSPMSANSDHSHPAYTGSSRDGDD